MIVGIIFLLLGVFLIFVAGIGVNDYDGSTSSAQTIMILFVIGVLLLISGGERMDYYIWPLDNKTESTLDR